MLRHKSPTVIVAACHCIGQVGRRNELPIPTRNLRHRVLFGTFDGIDERYDAEACSKEVTDTFYLTKHYFVEELLHIAVEKDVSNKVSFLVIIVKIILDGFEVFD